MGNIKTNLKRRLDQMGFLYQKYLLFRERYLPTVHQRNEKNCLKERVNFYAQFISENNLCFDVGAHYGNRTEVFLNLGANVIAIEPSKTHAKYLEMKFGDRIEIINKGLGSKPEVLEMYVSESASNSTFSKDWIDSVAESGRFEKKSWFETTSIPVTTMDLLIEQYGVPDFCKIDVEGFEFEVLSGLSTPVRAISVEFTVPERSDELVQVINKITELDNSYVFNYAFGENLALEKESWITADELINIVRDSDDFKRSQYGDIYAKRTNAV